MCAWKSFWASTISTIPTTWILSTTVKALQAYALYKRDVDYVVKDGEVIIVDEFTGRLMPGRRWSDGFCTRRLKPKRASKSPTRTRRWPR